MDALKELMKKKKDKGDMDPLHKEAKMGVLKDIHKLASDAMGDDVRNLKKVTVASDSEEGLQHGLDKAKDLIDGQADNDGPGDPHSGTEGDDDSTRLGEPGADDETPDMHAGVDKNLMPESAHDDLSDDEIDELIKALEMKRKK